MTSWAESHKPVASVSAHLMLAGVMWLVVGAALIGFGGRWLWVALPTVAPWLAAAAVAVGLVKSRLVLDGVAERVVGRISARGGGRCVGGFLSLRTWGLVLLMMLLGRLLRGTLSGWIVGPLYIAVGTALCVSSRRPWRAWRETRRGL